MKKILATATIICISLFSFGQETDVVWSQLVGASVSGTTLQKTGSNKGSAISSDILFGFGTGGAENDGYFRYVADQAIAGKQIGFSIYPSKHFKRSELKYSFYFNKTDKVRILEEGTLIDVFNYSIGDEFKIAREGEKIVYYINNVQVRNVPVNPREDLIIEAMLMGVGTTFSNVKKNFSGQPLSTIVEVNTPALSIDLTTSGGHPPYTYRWSTGQTTQDVTVPRNGVYSVTIKDSYGNTTDRIISVDQEVVWTGFEKSAEINQTLVRTGNGQWGGAYSTIPIAQNGDGWVEYTLESSGEPRAIGFVSTGTIVTKPQDLKYGIYILDDYTVRIIEENVIMLKFNYSEGDIFKVERKGLLITYSRNGVKMHSTNVAAAEELYIGGGIKTGSTLKKVRFGGDVPDYLTSTFDVANDYGSISVSGPTGNLPYTYLISYDPIPSLQEIWTEIRDSAFIDSLEFFQGKINSVNYTFNELPSGKYFVAIYDNNGAKLVHQEILVTPVSQVVDNLFIDISSENIWSVSNASPTNQGQGTILGMLPLTESGGYVFEVEAFNDFIIGYSIESAPQGKNPADFLLALGFEGRSGTFHIYLNGVDVAKRFARLTDQIYLGKEGSDFVVKLNEIEVYRGAVPTTTAENLKLDFAFNKGVEFKPLLYGKKYKYPRPNPVVLRYPVCGETNGDFALLWPKFPSNMSLSITSVTLVNNGSGPDFTLTAPDYSIDNIPIGTYTFTVQYNLSVTTIFGTTVTPYIFTSQVAIGYVVDWQIVNPSLTLVDPGTLNSIHPTTNTWSFFGAVVDATTIGQTTSGMENWVQFETQISPTEAFHSSEVFRLTNGSEFITLTTTAVFFGATSVSVAGEMTYSSTTLNPNGTFRVDEYAGALDIYRNGHPIISGTSTPGNSYAIEIEQYGYKPYYINTVASFCNFTAPLIYVTPKRVLEGGFYLVPTDDILHFEFFEEYSKPGDLQFTVKNYAGQTMTGLPALTEEFGDNRLALDVSSLVASNYYILEIRNDKNEIWYLRFKVQ